MTVPTIHLRAIRESGVDFFTTLAVYEQVITTVAPTPQPQPALEEQHQHASQQSSGSAEDAVVGPTFGTHYGPAQTAA